MSDPQTPPTKPSSPAVAKLEARQAGYQTQEADCIRDIGILNENIRARNEDRLRLSGAILDLNAQIAELRDEENGAPPDLAVLPKAPKSKSPLRHAAKR